mgnify:CR=1 FL=1
MNYLLRDSGFLVVERKAEREERELGGKGGRGDGGREGGREEGRKGGREEGRKGGRRVSNCVCMSLSVCLCVSMCLCLSALEIVAIRWCPTRGRCDLPATAVASTYRLGR